MARKQTPATAEAVAVQVELAQTTLPPIGPGKPFIVLATLTDKEVTEYAAFLLESVAHLQGRLGALNTHNLLGLAARIRCIGGAHALNVRIPTNWAAGPRDVAGYKTVVPETTLGPSGANKNG